ncbi:hypothetical protein DSL72_003977 [Monilinia vaccinii-corymbosi]|uniref:Uncharacterized protein n=1 Tax=Monilinia vaccinii-corymbosi TaxID=61207 RepID=A0A8A3NVF3_9HELO|nr:hypothetical protein DSL72_003977 [Monilinia vaccinii-corymbosi]
MEPTNHPKKQANMPSPNPPRTPVITPIVPSIPQAPLNPMGRKGSSMYFQQPDSRGQSSSAHPNNDRALFVSAEGDTMWDIGGLRLCNPPCRYLVNAALEHIPDFSLPEPASMAGLKRKADQSVAENTESVPPTYRGGAGHGDGQLEVKESKRKSSGVVTLPIREKAAVTFSE